ncbi:ParB/RepB/Spo0J family partition protein [Devosia alba]|uniref:ParB/RepB/Spo0J family partition protein n=1 Tax=Devosia alba TaxID=3152360 RepID=UPI003266C6DD
MHTLDTSITVAPKSDFRPGPAPMLTWIGTDRFVVDDTYQREIGKRGRQNINHIAENFDWSKFAPVIVAPVEGGKYAIVDGQHRTIAAMLRGLEEVPCQIVQADRAQQAAAYAAVNGNVTKTTAQQLFHAKLAAGHEDARELHEVCGAAGVKIVRRSVSLANMAVGETQAVGALTRCLKVYGRDTLITALQCITETADGNAGFVRATIIEGYCQALHGTPWVDQGETLLRAMDDFCIVDVWGEVTDGRDNIFPATVRHLVTERVRQHLERRLQEPGHNAVDPVRTTAAHLH